MEHRIEPSPSEAVIAALKRLAEKHLPPRSDSFTHLAVSCAADGSIVDLHDAPFKLSNAVVNAITTDRRVRNLPLPGATTVAMSKGDTGLLMAMDGKGGFALAELVRDDDPCPVMGVRLKGLGVKACDEDWSEERHTVEFLETVIRVIALLAVPAGRA